MTDSDQAPVSTAVRRRRRRRTEHRWLHKHKRLAVGGVATACALLLVSGWLGYLNEQVDDVHRFDLALASKDATDRPARVKGEALNILMVGLDSDNGATLGDDLYELIGTEEWVEHDFASDMLAVLHVSADRKRAQLVSVPGNSLVEVPGHPGERRIKEAFRLGGPDLTAETIEETFEVHMDHLMMLDFEAFKEVTEILGGVDVFVAETTRDDFNNRTWQAGVHRVEGQDALDYVRQIDGLPNGDFDRIRRQQAFLRAIWDKLASNRTLANPVKVTRLANQLHELIAVDQEVHQREVPRARALLAQAAHQLDPLRDGPQRDRGAQPELAVRAPRGGGVARNVRRHRGGPLRPVAGGERGLGAELGRAGQLSSGEPVS